MTDLLQAPMDRALDAVTPESMRTTLGAFCSGVVVVTALGEEPVGFTCQSFTSLSLDPPLVSLNPARTSTTWPRVRAVGRFAVNVLAADHRSLSQRFAVSGGEKFSGVAWDRAPGGSPVLRGSAAWMECELWREYDGGDHTIAVGLVTALGDAPGREPLLFHRGAYATTGAVR